jgi:hypothetical protein
MNNQMINFQIQGYGKNGTYQQGNINLNNGGANYQHINSINQNTFKPANTTVPSNQINTGAYQATQIDGITV